MSIYNFSKDVVIKIFVWLVRLWAVSLYNLTSNLNFNTCTFVKATANKQPSRYRKIIVYRFVPLVLMTSPIIFYVLLFEIRIIINIAILTLNGIGILGK